MNNNVFIYLLLLFLKKHTSEGAKEQRQMQNDYNGYIVDAEDTIMSNSC